MQSGSSEAVEGSASTNFWSRQMLCIIKSNVSPTNLKALLQSGWHMLYFRPFFPNSSMKADSRSPGFAPKLAAVAS